MALDIRQVEYYYTTVEDRPGVAYRLLAQLSSAEVSLLAFSAIPFGPTHTQLTIFPEKGDAFLEVAERVGLDLIGPQHAFLVQGDDHLGALSGIHGRLADADIDVYASSGVTDGRGRYGYVIYVKEGDHPAAAAALAVDPA